MACKCGSQIVLCNLPIRFDTYVGCSHGCRYCFVQKKNGQLEAVKKGDTVRVTVSGADEDAAAAELEGFFRNNL